MFQNSTRPTPLNTCSDGAPFSSSFSPRELGFSNSSIAAARTSMISSKASPYAMETEGLLHPFSRSLDRTRHGVRGGAQAGERNEAPVQSAAFPSSPARNPPLTHHNMLQHARLQRATACFCAILCHIIHYFATATPENITVVAFRTGVGHHVYHGNSAPGRPTNISRHPWNRSDCPHLAMFMFT